jgi:hypothetical protein
VTEDVSAAGRPRAVLFDSGGVLMRPIVPSIASLPEVLELF